MTHLVGADSKRPDSQVRRVPGQPDMWLFVLFEALLFTGYFSVYLALRTQNEHLFLQSQADLDLRVGAEGRNDLFLAIAGGVVQQDPHAHATVGGLEHLVHQHPGADAVVNDVVLQVEAALRVANQLGPGFVGQRGNSETVNCLTVPEAREQRGAARFSGGW